MRKKIIRLPEVVLKKPDNKICEKHFVRLKDGICLICKAKNRKLYGAKSHIQAHIKREMLRRD